MAELDRIELFNRVLTLREMASSAATNLEIILDGDPKNLITDETLEETLANAYGSCMLLNDILSKMDAVEEKYNLIDQMLAVDKSKQ